MGHNFLKSRRRNYATDWLKALFHLNIYDIVVIAVRVHVNSIACKITLIICGLEPGTGVFIF